MPSSDRKVTANRINGAKSPGPINTTSTRHNATKHSLTASGITELDNMEGYDKTLKDLTAEKKPVGVVERFLVQSLAVDMVRWQRARRLEAEFITAVLHPAQHEKNPTNDLLLAFNGPVIDPGLPAAISAASVQCLVSTFQRYESFFANRWSRTLHELERVQRMRQGECLPAPTAVDVTVRAETGTRDSVPVAPETAKVLAIDGESMPGPVTADVIHADTGVADSARAESEQQSVLAADGENSAALDAVDVARGESGMVVDSTPAASEPPKPHSCDVDVEAYAYAGIVDSVPAALEQPKDIPEDEG